MQSRDDKKTLFCSERMKLCQKHLFKVYDRSKNIFLRSGGGKESSSVYPASVTNAHARAEDSQPRNSSARSSFKVLEKTKVSPYLSAVSGLFDGPTLFKKFQFRSFQSSVTKSSTESPRARCPKYCKDVEHKPSVRAFFEHRPEHLPATHEVRHPTPWAPSQETLRQPSATAHTSRGDRPTQVERQEEGMGMEPASRGRCSVDGAAAPSEGVRQKEMKSDLLSNRLSSIPEVSFSSRPTDSNGHSHRGPSINPVFPSSHKVDHFRKWSQPDSSSERKPVLTTAVSGSMFQTSQQPRSDATSTSVLSSKKLCRIDGTGNRNPYTIDAFPDKSERSLQYNVRKGSIYGSAGADGITEATISSFSQSTEAPSLTREPLGNLSTEEELCHSNVSSKSLLKHRSQPSVRSGDTGYDCSLVLSTQRNCPNDLPLGPAKMQELTASRPTLTSESTLPSKDALSAVRCEPLLSTALVEIDNNASQLLSTALTEGDKHASQKGIQVTEAISRAIHLAKMTKANIKRLEKSSSSVWKHGSMALCTENPVRDYTTGASPPDFRIKHCSEKKVNWSRSGSRKVVNYVCQILKQHRWGPFTMETLDSLKGRLNSHCVNAVIQQIPDSSLALNFFNWAERREDYKHDVYTYTTMINALGRARNLQGVRNLLEEMHKDGCEPTVVTYNTLILIYGKVESLSESLRVFRIMKEAGCKPDNVTYSILIHLCVKSGFLQEALKLYQAMLGAGIQPDTITYSIVIDSLGKAGNLSEARRLFREMKEMGCIPNEFTYNSLIDRHAKSRQTKYALRCYQEMRSNGFALNPVICTTMMSVFATLGQFAEAEGLFSEMEQAGIAGDTAAYSLMINMWGQAGDLDKAVSWYGRMLGSMVTPSLSVFTSLVNAHLDLHLYEGAQHFLTSMSMWGISPDLKVYTSLLRHCTGCERQDHVDAVLGLMDHLGHPAHKFVFDLLTAKDQDRRNTRTRVEKFFDSVQHEDQEGKQAFANALIEFLHKLRCKTDPGFVWELALEKGLFPSAIIRREVPNHWLIDLHSMSVGTALVALPRLLLRIRDNWIQTPTKRVYIVTGWGKRSRVTGSSVMKQSVNELLQAAKSPFSVDHTNAGVFVSYGLPFCNWITVPAVRRKLGLDVVDGS